MIPDGIRRRAWFALAEFVVSELETYAASEEAGFLSDKTRQAVVDLRKMLDETPKLVGSQREYLKVVPFVRRERARESASGPLAQESLSQASPGPFVSGDEDKD